jgi:hypothetical protein
MASDPYYLVREEIQESVREKRGVCAVLGVSEALTRRAPQVNKLHAGQERWERYPAGSDSRATVAQDLVRREARRLAQCVARRALASRAHRFRSALTPRAAADRLVSATACCGRCARGEPQRCAHACVCAVVRQPAPLTHACVCASHFAQLEELERATAMAEKDYARFRIEKAELASRRSWNATTRTQVGAPTLSCPLRRQPAARGLANCLRRRLLTLARARATGRRAERHLCGSRTRPQGERQDTKHKVRCLAPPLSVRAAWTLATSRAPQALSARLHPLLLPPQIDSRQAGECHHEPERLVPGQPAGPAGAAAQARGLAGVHARVSGR